MSARVVTRVPPTLIRRGRVLRPTDAHDEPCTWPTATPRCSSYDATSPLWTCSATTPKLGDGWITTVEQTLLDLIARPHLGDVPDAAHDAITALLPRADNDLLRNLAQAQRRRTALDRVLAARP